MRSSSFGINSLVWHFARPDFAYSHTISPALADPKLTYALLCLRLTSRSGWQNTTSLPSEQFGQVSLDARPVAFVATAHPESSCCCLSGSLSLCCSLAQLPLQRSLQILCVPCQHLQTLLHTITCSRTLSAASAPVNQLKGRCCTGPAIAALMSGVASDRTSRTRPTSLQS